MSMDFDSYGWSRQFRVTNYRYVRINQQYQVSTTFEISQFQEADNTFDIELSGYIKWDGCSDINGDFHLCGFEQISEIAACLTAAYALAAQSLKDKNQDIIFNPPEFKEYTE